jgi:hypothetical protein
MLVSYFKHLNSFIVLSHILNKCLQNRDGQRTMVETRNMYQQEVDVLRRQLSGVKSTLQPSVSTLTPTRTHDDHEVSSIFILGCRIEIPRH